MIAFAWPFFVSAGVDRSTRATVAPFIFGVALLLVLAVVLADIADGGLDSKALALLGVLSALGAALRPLSAGTAGVELVFFVLVLGGRALGPGFGFTLGCTTLFASAMITGGVGPWMPYQMFGCAWVGLGAGLLPRAYRPARDLRCSSRTARCRRSSTGSAQPLVLAVRARRAHAASRTFRARRSPRTCTATSCSTRRRRSGWDTGRAITNAVLLLVAGAPVLAALRRAARRASFDAPGEFVPAPCDRLGLRPMDVDLPAEDDPRRIEVRAWFADASHADAATNSSTPATSCRTGRARTGSTPIPRCN